MSKFHTFFAFPTIIWLSHRSFLGLLQLAGYPDSINEAIDREVTEMSIGSTDLQVHQSCASIGEDVP